MKFFINFKVGEYSPIKDDFKKCFAGILKWDNKQAWTNKTEYIRASKKMETGQAVKFFLNVEEKIAKRLEEFCEANKIDMEKVESFGNEIILEAKKEEVIIVKLDRVPRFLTEARVSHSFAKGWAELLRKDDERLNKMLMNSELETISVSTLFEIKEEDMLA